MIDMNDVRNVLDEAAALLVELEQANRRGLVGTDVPTDGVGNRQARSEKAYYSKQLMLLADRLELAAALARTQYWVFKGTPDPLYSEGSTP